MDYIFRGFHPDKNGTQAIVANGKEYKGKWIEGDLLSKCKGSPKISINGEYNRGLFVVDSYEVIPETVGQFTGLTDKNGKKIFEHDRIKYKCGEFAEVIFAIYGAFVGRDEYSGHNSIDGEVLIEVIGTIFDKEADNG